MKLHILGSGVCASQLGNQIPNRFPPGFVVEWENQKIMFECSEGIRFRLEKMGFDYGSIKHLAISHCHPDHYNLVHYYQSIYCKGLWCKGENYKKFQIKVFCPDFIKKTFPSLWKCHIPEISKQNHYDFPALKFFPMSDERKRHKISNGILSAKKVSHGFNKVDALAYRLETPQSTFVFSGDTGDCKGIREVVKNANLFLCECSARINSKPGAYGHLTPKLAGEIAKDGNVKTIVFYHYTGLDSDKMIIKDCLSSGFTGKVIVGKDFRTISF